MMLLLVQLRDAIYSGGTSLVSSIYSRLGAPAGASMSADIAAIKAETALIKGYTDTEMAAVYAREVVTSTNCIPVLANGIGVTGAAGAWTLGAFATLAAANSIPNQFYVTGVHIEAISGADVYEMVLYHGASDTEFARIRFVGTGYYLFPASKAITGNDQIRAKVASAAGGGKVATVSLAFHF